MPKEKPKFTPPKPGEAVLLSDLPDFERIPTGMAALDIVTRGGIPIGTNSLFTGPEASGKTVMVTCALARYLDRFPDKKCVYVSADNKLTKEGMELRNGDSSRIEILRPTTAVAAHYIILSAVEDRADIGIVVIDSLASMTSDREVIGEQEMGVLAGENNKFFRKFTAAQLKRFSQKNPLTVLCINQERWSIGMFSSRNPPGGKQQNFQAALWVEFDKADTHFEPTTKLSIAQTFRYHFRKNEGGVVRDGLETRMVTTPYGHWKVGDFQDHDFAWVWASRLGVVRDRGNRGMEYLGECKLQKEWIVHLETHPEFYAAFKAEVTKSYIAWRKSELHSNFLEKAKKEAEEKKKKEKAGQENNLVEVTTGGTVDEGALEVS